LDGRPFTSLPDPGLDPILDFVEVPGDRHGAQLNAFWESTGSFFPPNRRIAVTGEVLDLCLADQASGSRI
jgi:hypothetical protein